MCFARLADHALELLDAFDGLAIDREDQVALLDAGAGCGVGCIEHQQSALGVGLLLLVRGPAGERPRRAGPDRGSAVIGGVTGPPELTQW